MSRKTIKVLIVDDSAVVRDLLTFILTADPAIQVVGVAANGQEAVQAVQDKRPDVVTMDVIMPVMDGLDATRLIMETIPTPIVIVSASWNHTEVEKAFQTIEAGALAAVEKPVGVNHPDYARMTRELIQTVKLMAEVKVVKRQSRARTSQSSVPVVTSLSQIAPINLKMVAIGASTGGPQAIKTILAGLPKDFPAPLLMVQHIAAGFVQGFADWLTDASGFPVKVAAHGEFPRPGYAYVAPDDRQMGIGNDGNIMLCKSEPENGLCPSVSYLFRSVANVLGKNAVGILLTGMGKDGAQELKLLRDKGAVTIAQDRESAVIYGMPGEAVALNAASVVLSPAKIAEFLGGFR